MQSQYVVCKGLKDKRLTQVIKLLTEIKSTLDHFDLLTCVPLEHLEAEQKFLRYLIDRNNTITTQRLSLFRSNNLEDDVIFRKEVTEGWGLKFEELLEPKGGD